MTALFAWTSKKTTISLLLSSSSLEHQPISFLVFATNRRPLLPVYVTSWDPATWLWPHQDSRYSFVPTSDLLMPVQSSLISYILIIAIYYTVWMSLLTFHVSDAIYLLAHVYLTINWCLPKISNIPSISLFLSISWLPPSNSMILSSLGLVFLSLCWLAKKIEASYRGSSSNRYYYLWWLCGKWL